MKRLYPVTTIQDTEKMKKMTEYNSTPIAYASYPATGVVRTDRKFKAQIQFYTGSAWGRGTWDCTKTFNDEGHLDNFIAYIERTKGWNLDEVWYVSNITPLKDSWAYQGDPVNHSKLSAFHKPNGWKARRAAGL